jgi:multimeric flavodoxin WrbA
MLKVLAIMGSPRKGKNNDILLDYMLKGIKKEREDAEVDKLYVSDLVIYPCIACEECTRKPGCILQDEMNHLYKKYDGADIIIITSPMYFNSVSAQLKAVIDRNQAIWSSKYILGQPLIDRKKKRLGYFIFTSGDETGCAGLTAAEPIINLFFKSINAEYVGNYFVKGSR